MFFSFSLHIYVSKTSVMLSVSESFASFFCPMGKAVSGKWRQAHVCMFRHSLSWYVINTNNMTVNQMKSSRWLPVASCLLRWVHVVATHSDCVGGRPCYCVPNPLMIQTSCHFLQRKGRLSWVLHLVSGTYQSSAACSGRLAQLSVINRM